MYAGKGIEHSDFNHNDQILNLLQIWIEPNKKSITRI
jgi:redox-sensitive bicupin YhaK (pirin superfamily)